MDDPDYLDFLLNVESFTVHDYANALSKVKLTDKQLQIFNIQYSRPDRGITAQDLAIAMGNNNTVTGNGMYGTLGHKLAELLPFSIPLNRYSDSSPGWYRVLSSGKWVNDRFVWTMLPALAEALEILGYIHELEITLPEEVPSDITYREGDVRRITINAYERSVKARNKCIEHHGSTCFICDFDFSEIYGEIGQDYIHVHHLKLLSEIGETYVVDPIKDLIPVCPNCHAMLHKKNPPYSPDELRNMLNRG